MTDETLIKSVSASYTAEKCPCCGGTTFRYMFRKDQFTYEKCLNCYSARINPQPTDSQLDAIYKMGYYANWGEEDNYSRLKKDNFLNFFNKHLRNLPPNAKILDIGAATGRLMEVASELGYEPYGVEVAHDGCDRIRKLFGPDKVYQGYFSQDSFSSMAGQFDAVIMFDVIEHVRDPNEAIQTAKYLLKEDGYFVAVTPMMGALSQRIAGKTWEHFVSEHLFYFSVKGARQIIENNDLEYKYVLNFPKKLNISYIDAVMAHNGTSWCLFWVIFILRLLPKWIKKIPFSIRYGQMIIVAQK